MLMLNPTLSPKQAETLEDIEVAIRFFKNHDNREGITFQQVLDKAGVDYNSFHYVVKSLKRRKTTQPLRRLAALLREIDVLKKVAILADIAKEENEDEGSLPQTPVSRVQIQAPDGDEIDAQLMATQIIAKALKPLSQPARESVLMSMQGMFRIGVV